MQKTLCLVIAAVIVFSCQQKEQKSQSVVIGTMDSIRSEILNETRPYWVYVPPRDRNATTKYPVLYLLDGDAHFHSVSGLIQILGTGINGTNIVPEMIIVAIPNTARTRDLTPTHSVVMDGKPAESLKSSGGGDKFLQFIKDELIPHIDSHYPTSPYRVLVGHSFGGITAIHALYTIPETFDSYIAIDPSLWWDDHLLVKKADSMLDKAVLRDKYVFLAQANTLNPGESTNDHFGAIKDYLKVLESKGNTGVKWSYKYYPDDHHGSVPLIAEYDGLRFIFSDFNPTFEQADKDPEKVLKNYARYHIPAPEGVINHFGYNAMAIKDFDLAFRYFQLNVDNYPGSSNAFDSMGEFWMNKGDTTQAIVNYDRSIQLDPRNDNAKSMIKKMRQSLSH